MRSIEQLRSTASYEDHICGKGYSILVIQAMSGFSAVKTTLLVISTIKQKECSHENFLLHF